jgi:hypothetical protein
MRVVVELCPGALQRETNCFYEISDRLEVHKHIVSLAGSVCLFFVVITNASD